MIDALWLWFIALPPLAMIPVGIASIVIAFVSVRVFLGVCGVILAAIAYGISAFVRAAVPAIAGRIIQVGAMLLFLIAAGCGKAWAPFGNAIDRSAERMADRMTPEEKEKVIEDAPAILGLSGEFTKQEMEDQFKRLMKICHQDVTGVAWMSQRLNQARDELRAVKGWKK
ncbi:hypothetical protein [Rhodopila sp.]|uniref:hypothetical protein n=1 Tax=Rhodopila sp. TaxID=2480087 RepID=UPI003D101D5F